MEGDDGDVWIAVKNVVELLRMLGRGGADELEWMKPMAVAPFTLSF